MKIEGLIFYIAGPVTGIEDGNRPLFDQAQYWLEGMGAVALNPQVLPAGLRSHASYLAICLPMLREADAILMLPGWHKSVGARMEYDAAVSVGMPVYNYEPIRQPAMALLATGAIHGH
jgi:hypothetical protein